MTFARDGYGPNRAAPLRRKTLLVGCALGSSAISRHVPGGDLYIDAVAKVTAAVASQSGNRIVAFDWMQGEANSDAQAVYAASLDSVIAGWRATGITGASDAPWLIHGLGDDFLSANPANANVQLALIDTPNRNTRCIFVSSVGLPMVTPHFTAAAQRTMAASTWTAFNSAF